MKHDEMNRRDFLKVLGGGAAVAGMSLAGCKPAEGRGGNTIREVPTDKMTYRKGRHGEKVSVLGYGCMRWPTVEETGGQPSRDGNNIDQEQVNRLVKYALDHGVNYFDSSPAYCRGFSEKATGDALVASGYPRESYYIATKLSNFAQHQYPLVEGQKMFENSLRFFHTDYIDFMLLHAVGGGGMDNLHQRFLDNGLLDWLVEQREKGRIRNLGFSFHGDIEVYDWLLAHHDTYQWDFVQIQLNYMDWHNARFTDNRSIDAHYLYEELRKRDIPAVIMEPLLGGRLAKLPTSLQTMMRQRRPDDSVASWAFRFAGTPEGVLTCLSGMTYMEHLQDNLLTYSPLDPVAPEEDAMLLDIVTKMKTLPLVPCNACQYCMPCPYGLDIPAILTHYNKCVTEGNYPQSKEDGGYKEARRAFLVGYDRSVPRLRQAAHCIACGQCNPHCPQRINIPKEMQRIDDYVERLKQETL